MCEGVNRCKKSDKEHTREKYARREEQYKRLCHERKITYEQHGKVQGMRQRDSLD